MTTPASDHATARFARVRAIFDAALDVPEPRRAAFVHEACAPDAPLAAEVLHLLAADATETTASALLERAPQALVEVPELSGTAIPGFEIVRCLGRGGMGVVYEAVQDRPARTVALKTLVGGFANERARRRFEDEVELLARVRHPGIAQVLAAGTARCGDEDVPWFAMELVEGPKPIDAYVAERGRDVPQVVGLMRAVADAVHAAHQRGVIHRDLKPGNVLVDVHGRVKVIDFGIAGLIDGDAQARRTATGELFGTLAYMSPERLEQGGGGLDTAADVYALGVVLYELLAGRTPFDLDGLAPARAIDLLRAHDAPPPSQRAEAGRVPLELDWIVGKAMARDSDQRYASVAELAADLERFARDEPVQAGPPSATYRLRKLARRHRVALTIAGTVVAALAFAAVVATIGWVRVSAAEQRALREAETLAAVNRFQQRILRGAYGQAKGRDVRLADVVQAAAGELVDQPLSDPVVAAGLHLSLGVSYLGLGMSDDAERELLTAQRLLPGDEAHLETLAAIRNNLGLCYESMGRLVDAERELRAGLALQLSRHGPAHDETSTTTHNLSSLLLKLGRPAEALGLAREAHSGFAARHAEGSHEVVTALSTLAQAQAMGGDLAAADATFATAWAATCAHLDPDHPARLSVASARAAHLRRRGLRDEYRTASNEIAAVRERTLGPAHPDTWIAWNNVAVGQLDCEDFAGAEATLRRILDARAAAGAVDGFEVAGTSQNLAYVVRRQGRAADAEVLARHAHALAERSLPAGHWLIGVTAKEIGACLRELGRFADAERALRGAFTVLQAAVGDDDFRTQKTVAELVQLFEDSAQSEQAEIWRARLGNGR